MPDAPSGEHGVGRRDGKVLLTVSGVIDPDVLDQVRRGDRPLPDYVELARVMDADVVDVAEARRRAGRFGRLLERVGGAGALLGWVCFRQRRRYDAVFTDGEQVGLPLALLSRLTFRRAFAHVMIVHLMSPPKKAWLYRAFRLGRYIDTAIVYSTAQQRFLTERLGQPAERVVFTPFMVDTEFFDPDRVEPAGAAPMICSAGLEFRDYPTLMEAVRGLDLRVVIAAASPWSKRDDSTTQAEVPANVEVCRLGFVDLRQLYADATFVVMPLVENDFQAGVTTILEAMAMGKAVVCSRTAGQQDIVIDGVSGVYVPPGDDRRLRAAIEELLADPQRVATLGAAAREQVVHTCDLHIYADRLGHVVLESAARHG